MRSIMSHGRLNLARMALWIGVPSLVSLAGGLALVAQAITAGYDYEGRLQAQNKANQEAVSEVRSLSESLWSEIANIRASALAAHASLEAASARRSPGSLTEAKRVGERILAESGILYLAELQRGSAEGEYQVKRTLRNPEWKESLNINSDYLQKAAQQISASDLKENGTAVLRLRLDPQRSREWLGFVFEGPEQKVLNLGILAVIDPSSTLRSLKQWGSKNAGRAVRSYLIANDGIVVAHSQESYNGANFGSLPLFQNAVTEAIAGRRLSGAGTYQSVDSIPVRAAYIKARSLPFGVVVESVISESPVGMAAVWKRLPHTALYWVLGISALGVVVSMALMLAAYRRNKRLRTEQKAKAIEDNEIEELQRNLRRASIEAARIKYSQDVLRIEEVAPREDAYSGENVQPTYSIPASMDEQMIEFALSRELREDAQSARSNLAKRVAMAQFEMDMELLDQPNKLAQRTTNFLHQMLHDPVLFFAYDERNSKAVLQACTGVDADVSGKVFFPIKDNLPERVANDSKNGQILDLSAYGALVALSLRLFRVNSFKAWPLQGAQGKFLGVVVTFTSSGNAANANHHPSEEFVTVIRKAGQFYENVRSG